MSEIPPSGGADGPKAAVAPVARRSWPRRVARGVFVAGALAVAAIAVLLLFLHLPAGRSSVRAILEKQLSALVDGRVRLGSLDYDLLRGRVEVGDAQLDAEGLSLHVERAEATAGPWAGVRLRVVRPVVIVRDTDRPKPPEPAVGLAARPWGALDRLAAAELVDARVELRDARGTAYAVLGPLDATLEEGGAPRAVRVTLRDGAVVPPGGGAELKPLKGEGRLVVEGARLVIENATVAADGVSIDASGALERVSPTEGRLALRAGADIARLAAGSAGARVEGRVLAEASVTLAGGDATGTLRLATPGGITVGTLGPWNAAASGRFDSRRLVLEAAEVTGSAARLAADGVVGVDRVSPTELRLRVAALDVRALARAAADADLPVRALLEGSLRYTTKGLDPAEGRASGSLTLRPAPAAAPRRGGVPPGVPLAGSADLAVEGRRVHVRRLRLEARDTRLAGELSLSPELDVDGRFEATVPLAAAGALAADVGAEARPELAGTIEARGTIAGPVKAPTVAFALRGEGLAPVGTVAAGTVSVEGAGRYAGGRVALEPLVLRSGGGQAVLRGGLPLDAASGAWDLEGEARALELGPLLAAAGVEAGGPLNGRLRVDGPYGRPAARGDLDARLSLAGVAEPLRMTASGSFAEGRLDVERFVAEVAGGRVEAHGTYDTATHATKASGSASGLRLGRAPGWPAALRGLDGRVGGAFDVAGTPDAPVGTARVSIEETTLDGRPLPGVRLGATADGARLELEGATRTDAGGDPREATFLRGRGALGGDWPLRLELDLSALPAQALFDALPAAEGASIRADGRVVVEVSARDPRRVRYTGEGLALSGRLRELEWSTEPFRVQGGSEEATISGLRLSTRSTAGAAPRRDDTASSSGAPAAAPAGGTLSIEGRVPFAADRAFDLAIEGGLDLAALQAIAPEDRAAGTATLRARVRGTLEAPDVRGSFGLTGARGRFGGTRVSQAELRGRFEGAEAFLDEASARVLGGAVRATGSLPFAALGAGRAARLRFEATDVDLSRLAIPFAERTPETPSFLVSASGEISATAPRLDAVRAEGRFTRIESVSPEGRVGLVAPAAWRLADGRFVQEPIRLAGPLGTVEARAEARLGGRDSGGSAVIAGPFDLRMIGPFVPDTSLAGPARADLRAAWGPEGTTVDGGITVTGGRVTLETLQFTATKLEGEVRFAGDHATLHATAASGDGQLSADGRMSFGPGLLGPAELALDARRVPISYPEGFRGRATGVLRVAGDAGRYEVTGDVAVSQAYYTADFDARGQSLDRLDYQLAAIDGETSLTERLPLRIAVRLADPVRVRNSQASLDIVGTFAVGGTLAQPVATGQLSLLEGGRLTIRRARVRPQDGRVELNGYPTGVPEVDFNGVTQVGGVAMTLRAQGSMEDLQLDIASSNRPDLSQSDLLSLLLTGRTAQAAASQSAAIVAEELASALGGALQKGVGETFLIDVSSDQTLLLDESDPTERFNVGTRLRQDLAVVYSTRLDGTEQRFVVEWNPRGGRFRVRGIDDRASGLAAEVTDRLSFDLVPRRRSASASKPAEPHKLTALRLEGGPPPLAEKELVDAAGLTVGHRYDPPRIEQAADAVRAKLVQRGFRGAAVDAVSEPVAGHERSRFELVLRVVPGPHVAVAWTGDDPGERLRREAMEAWPAYASPEAAASAVARALRVCLQARGFYEARVEARTRTEGDQAEVTFEVTRGPKGSRVAVAFEGNSVLGDARLAATLPKPGSRAFFEALDRSARLTAEARIAYASAGHLRARVGPPRTAFDAATGVLTVTIPVRERGASRVARVDLPREVADAGAARPALRLRAGQPFDVEAYLADRDAIAAWYREEGWMEARVRGVLEPRGEDVDVSFAAEPGPRPRRGEVRIASRGRTRDAMVLRQVEVAPGAVIRPQELSQTRARLSEMDVFTSVDVRPVPVAGQPDVRDLVVSYVERPDVTLEYGLRYDVPQSNGSSDAASAPSQGRLQAAAGFELANPFGLGWRLKGYTLQTTNLHNYRLGVESSTFLGLRLRTQLLFFDETDNESLIAASFASKVRGFSLQQTRTLLRDTGSRRWHDRLRLQWGYTRKDIQYSEDVGSDVLVAGRRAYLSLSLIGDWRDSLTDPRRGLFWTATAEMSRRYLGSDVDYVRLYGQLFTYVPLAKRLVWASGYRAGVVPGDDPFYLLENRFQSGGPTTVRGFRQNGLGPQFDESEGFGGQGVLVLNQELRFPIWKQIHGGVFWDAGNTWLLASELSLRDLRHTVGGGLRLMLPFGPIRVEYGFILDRRKNSDGTYVEPLGRFVFGLGHAF